MNNTITNNLPLQPLLFSKSDIEECVFVPVKENADVSRIEMKELTSESLKELLHDPEVWRRYFFSAPTEKEIEVASQWNTLGGILPYKVFSVNRIGRTGFSLSDILAVRVVMSIYKCNAHAAIETLKRSPNLRTITGMNKVPSDAVVSRKTNELIDAVSVYDLHHMIVKAYFSDVTSMNISIDSTTIEAREKPVRTEKPEPKKRGRKKKGSEEERIYLAEQAEIQRIDELSKTGDVDEFLDTLKDECSITGKKNSKGHMQWKIGYKAHIASDDRGIPVAFFTTGACVHDSNVAIPLIRKSKEVCTFSYVLMDGGYSSSDIEDFTREAGYTPIIDFKANNKGEKREMTEDEKLRYKKRTTVERTNSELKECFLISKLYSRGAKAHFDIQLALLLLTVKKIRENLNKEQTEQAA
jgi:IS5 family transposase